MKKSLKKIMLLVILASVIFIINSSDVFAAGGCKGYTNKSECENNDDFSCLWVENKYGSYCNADNLVYVSCGNAKDIPSQVPELTSFFVNLLKIATPIILIIVGIITLVKALAASSEDAIKKAQKSLITKVIAAVIVFFVISIVQFVILKVADTSEKDNITSCLSCFLNNDCGKTTYYKTSWGSMCTGTYLSDGSEFDCNPRLDN